MQCLGITYEDHKLYVEGYSPAAPQLWPESNWTLGQLSQ
jgi:hypothetical protein